MSEYKIETKCVQSGYSPKNSEPRVLPIYQSTTYKYDSAEHLGKLFDLEAPGHMYTRISNPTVEQVEKKICELEGGSGAVLLSSGQSANMLAVLNITSAGQNIIALSSIYGGTFNLYGVTLKRLGIDVRFISPDLTDEEIEKSIDENTRLIFGETISNPSLRIFDIERYAKLAHRHNIPLVIDNTFATPILCRPFEFGADIVTHSTTKYMDGHATVVGGCVVDGGKFNWENGKYPELTEPDESYHGISYTKKFGCANAYFTKLRVQLVRDIGNAMTPFSAFILNLGLETLHLRMERHSKNALDVARWLRNDSRISWVNYPLLEDSSQYELAMKYVPKGACGVVSFGVKGGRRSAMKFMDSLKLASIVVHVADARTSVLHPASTTHRQLTDKQLEECGITPDFIRLSVGIENVNDIIADISQALDKASV
jgi:O-acetylhomoserine (thiol)-lyase